MADESNVRDAYRALTEQAAVRLLSTRAHVIARDRHRDRFLHNMTTCTIKGLAAGQGCFGLSVDRGGKLVGQLFVEVESDAIRVEVDADEREAIVAHWLAHRVADMVKFEDLDGLSVVNLAGPRASELLVQLGLSEASSLDNHAWLDRTLAGVDCRVRRNDDRLDLMGFDLTVQHTDADRLVDALREAGASALSQEVWDAHRVLRGVPSEQVDMNAENIPLESEHLTRAISWDKGCYIGQEVIARMHYRGNPNRYLRGLAFESEGVHAGEALLTEEGKEAGVVGSVSVDPENGQVIALAVVKRRFSDAGTLLHTARGHKASVVVLPFRGAAS